MQRCDCPGHLPMWNMMKIPNLCAVNQNWLVLVIGIEIDIWDFGMGFFGKKKSLIFTFLPPLGLRYVTLVFWHDLEEVE